MRVFTDERLDAMRVAARRGLSEDRMFGSARFTAALRADSEQVTVTFGDSASRIDLADAGEADFSLRAKPVSWERYFAADGSALYSSIVGLMTASDCTGGVRASEVVPEGDLVRLFANLPILTRILESAAQPTGA